MIVRFIYATTALVALFGYTFFVWNAGFVNGLDTALCVQEYYLTKKPPIEIAACGRVNSKTLFFQMRQALPEAWK
jgi:hypothetical protein